MKDFDDFGEADELESWNKRKNDERQREHELEIESLRARNQRTVAIIALVGVFFAALVPVVSLPSTPSDERQTIFEALIILLFDNNDPPDEVSPPGGGGVGTVELTPTPPQPTVPSAQSSCTQAANASARVGGLTVTVDQVTVLQTGGTTKTLELEVRRDNQSGDSLTFPLFGYFLLTGVNGRTYEADSFGSSWNNAIPNGIAAVGTIIVPGVEAGVTTASISFTTIFGTLGPERNGITVTGIPIPC